jgi:TolA-binding protein
MPIVSPPSRDSTIEPPFFWERYKAEIVAALVVGLLAMAAAGGYRLYTIHRDSSAAELLAAAKTSGDFQNVIARFPNTPACAAAYLLLANEQRSQKKFADSNANLEALIAKFPRHELLTTAWMGMAANFESLGKKDEALTTYQRLLANYPKDFNAPLAMISQVHLLVEKNQIEEARRVCENIMTQHRESAVAGEAARQLRMLGGGKLAESSTQTGTSVEAKPQGAPPPSVSKPVTATPGKP